MAFSLFQPYTNLPVKPKSLACVHLSLCGIRGFESAFIIVCLVFVVLKVHLSPTMWFKEQLYSFRSKRNIVYTGWYVD